MTALRQATTGSASVTVGDYSQVIVKADVNGPLSETAGFSLSGSFNQRDGYYENLAGGDALALPSDVGPGERAIMLALVEQER